MTTNNINTIINHYSKRIPKDSSASISSSLTNVSDDNVDGLLKVETKNPLVVFVFSFFLGFFGADRFYLGDKPIGFVKLGFAVFLSLLSLGVNLIDYPTMEIVAIIGAIFNIFFAAWWIADIFMTYSSVKVWNLSRILYAVQKAQ